MQVFKYREPNKSVFKAYLCYFLGGLFGLHHFYLGNDFHAFVWWSTMGCLGVGWLSEIFSIPGFVRQCNNYSKQVGNRVTDTIRMSKAPQFSLNRFLGMLALGYSWGCLCLCAIPLEGVLDYDLRYANVFVPLAVALGVWAVGNMDKQEEGGIFLPLVAAYACYPLRYVIYNDSTWVTIIAMSAGVVFECFGKTWRRVKQPASVAKRLAILGTCGVVYLSLWGSFLYFNGTFTNVDGVEMPLHEAVQQFFTSPWWADLQQSLYDLYLYAQHHGWYEVWKQLLELDDTQDVEKAYKILGVNPNSSQQEITAQWRLLSRTHHPDKVKDESKRREAQEHFMEIQQAYEILSNSKNRRQRQNQRDNSL